MTDGHLAAEGNAELLLMEHGEPTPMSLPRLLAELAEIDASMEADRMPDALRRLDAAMALVQSFEPAAITQTFGSPLQFVAARGALAGLLCNAKRYDRALTELRVVRATLLEQFVVPESVRTQIETDIQYARKQLGVTLLRELPERLARKAKAALTQTEAPSEADWVVDAALVDAVHGASVVLREYLGEAENERPADSWEAIQVPELLRRVGSLLRKHADDTSADPESVPVAARYLVQLDRVRRTRKSIETAGRSPARPGPFNEGGSRYVLYLRSFIASERLPRVALEPWGVVDLEELIAGWLDELHTVALGRAELERFGPGRLAASDAEWKDVVRTLANEARSIVVLPLCTEGTCWEIEWVTTNKFLTKTVFVMPPSKEENREWWEQRWNELRAWALPLRLHFPEYSVNGLLFRVTRDGGLTTRRFDELFGALTGWSSALLGDMPVSDYLYGIQQELAHEAQQRRSAESEAAKGTRVAGYAKRIATLTTDPVEQSVPALLAELECGAYGEFQSWAAAPTQVPDAPGVVAFFEGPANIVFVEAVDNVRSALERAANGESCPFTRGVWNFELVPHLTQQQLIQLKQGEVTIERLVSFHVRSWFMYRYLTIEAAALRTQIEALVNQGAFDGGRPRFQRK